MVDSQWSALADSIQTGQSVRVSSLNRASRFEEYLVVRKKRCEVRKAGNGYVVTCIGVNAGFSFTSAIPLCGACAQGRHAECDDGQRYSVKRSPVECGCTHVELDIPARIGRAMLTKNARKALGIGLRVPPQAAWEQRLIEDRKRMNRPAVKLP